MTDIEFTPALMGRDILHPRSRSSVAEWLNTKPKTYDGHEIVAIRQEFFCEPVEDLDPLSDPIQVASFEHLSVRPSGIYPIVKHTHGHGSMWSGEVVDDHMAGYRDPYFELSHDETYGRLINSDLMVLAAPEGSAVYFYHFANGSFMMSTALASKIAAEDHDKGDWQGALVTAILPRAESRHDLISRAGQIKHMNELLWSFFCSGSDNFEAFRPKPIPVDIRKFS